MQTKTYQINNDSINSLHHLGGLFMTFIGRCLSLLVVNGINTKLGVLGMVILLLATLFSGNAPQP